MAVDALAVQRLVEAGGDEVGVGEVRQVRQLEAVLLRELPAPKGAAKVSSERPPRPKMRTRKLIGDCIVYIVL